MKEADGRIEIINSIQAFYLYLLLPLGVTNPMTPGGFPFLEIELEVGVEQTCKKSKWFGGWEKSDF